MTTAGRLADYTTNFEPGVSAQLIEFINTIVGVYFIGILDLPSY
jgi:hypothetical protein